MNPILGYIVCVAGLFLVSGVLMLATSVKPRNRRGKRLGKLRSVSPSLKRIL